MLLAPLPSPPSVQVGVWALWQASPDVRRRKQMFDHFTVSYAGLRAGRVHTLLTSAFSQKVPLLRSLRLLVFVMLGGPGPGMPGGPLLTHQRAKRPLPPLPAAAPRPRRLRTAGTSLEI